MPDLLATACALVDPLPSGERRSLLVRWADRLERAAESLAQTITTATQKPIRLARHEVKRAVAVVRSTADAMVLIEPRLLDLGDGGKAEITRVALGPVLAVTPFNFPLNLACHKLAPALAGGCPVIWKPSPRAPGVAELALELLDQAGCPEGLVQVAHLSDDAVAALVADERLALLSFTGSDVVGRRLQRLATRARVVLELGGNAVVILHRTTDIDAAARTIAFGACANAGQSCVSVQRILIPDERDDWRDALTAAFAALPTGDPSDEAILCGPVIDAAAKTRIQHLIARYLAQGGRFLTGGTWNDRTLAPTLIDGLPAWAPGVHDTEAFAPLATLHRYHDLAEALHFAELTPYGLQAGLYTDDDVAMRFAFSQLNVGALVINDVPTRRDDRLPFGGMKESGCGREGTFESILDFTQPKVLWRPA